MSFLGSLSFGTPWLLAALALLPAIYWLLRVTPPPPRRQVFPPLRLLLGLVAREETPARTPLWLLLLRLFIAGLFIVALAEPLLGAKPQVARNAPLILFVDNGWTAAAAWQTRQNAMTDALHNAARAGRPVALVVTADPHPTPDLLDAGQAARRLTQITPRSWLPDRLHAAAALSKTKVSATPDILWLSDGLDYGDGARAAAALSKTGHLRILADTAGGPLALLPPGNAVNGFTLTLRRAETRGTRRGRVEALGRQGELLGEKQFAFAPGAEQTNTKLQLPLEMRNKAARVAVTGEDSAGATQLLDSGNRRRAVGLISAGNSEAEQPLLSDLYYLDRALSPYAELRKGSIADLLRQNVSVLVLADIGRISGADRGRVARFVSNGGLLIRFAGARMTENVDDLIPVRLRKGGRYLGGAMAWSAPQHLAAFPDSSPFAAMPVPHEVTVSRQVLAEPSIELGERTWARLADGTPLVTAEHRGKGWIVLFHVTASPAWSSLPLSGLYVDMLRRLLDLAGTSNLPVTLSKSASYPPLEMLDGFGVAHKPSPEVLPLRATELAHASPSAAHPAGYYGSEGNEIALNAVSASFHFTRLGGLNTRIEGYAAASTLTLAPWLFVLAFLLLLADTLISLIMRGYLQTPSLRLPASAAGMLLFASLVLHPRAAKADDAFALQSALDTRLAYVRTGLADVDAMSKAGLVGLDVALTQRTSYEPQQPMAVDLDKDELAFFPLLYWPMDPREKDLSPKALSKIADYMRNGGTILFDTRDLTLGAVQGTQSPGQQTLRRLVAKLDLPPLEVVPPDHVLTKAFYLLKNFLGRWDGSKVWVEALPPADPDAGPAPARGGDGVSPVIIGGNDWAAAWAVDGQGRPLVEPVPGGERQREMAIRFGINVVMYAFTGNYKTDQVHAPALLERLKQ